MLNLMEIMQNESNERTNQQTRPVTIHGGNIVLTGETPANNSTQQAKKRSAEKQSFLGCR